LHKSLSGPSREILETLYHELNLHKEALTQLRDTDWSEKADAVRELSQMCYMDAKNKILKLTTHENKVLRLEAQAAMLSLNTEDPFGFLEKAKMELTEWQQLNLEEHAKRIDLKKIPNFSKWFSLSNQSVVQFCIKMTVAYNQFESADAVVELLRSHDLRVVKESVKAAGYMLIDEAKRELFKIFDIVTPEIQDQIIISLGKIGGEDAIGFLKNLMYTSEPDLQIKAGMSLRSIGYEADDILQKALQSEDPSISVIALHILDERI
jgi:HEAT repeat protein